MIRKVEGNKKRKRTRRKEEQAESETESGRRLQPDVVRSNLSAFLSLMSMPDHGVISTMISNR